MFEKILAGTEQCKCLWKLMNGNVQAILGSFGIGVVIKIKGIEGDNPFLVLSNNATPQTEYANPVSAIGIANEDLSVNATAEFFNDNGKITGKMFWANSADDKNGIRCNEDGIKIETYVAGSTNSTVTVNKTTGIAFNVGGTIVFEVTNAGAITAKGLTTYADDAAAITGGLTSGKFYKHTAGGITTVCVVP